jgi:hypothetical protein
MYHFGGVKIITIPFTCFINLFLHVESVIVLLLHDYQTVLLYKLREYSHAKNIKILLCLLQNSDIHIV